MSACDELNINGEGEGGIKVALRELAWVTRWTVMLLTKTGNEGEFST